MSNKYQTVIKANRVNYNFIFGRKGHERCLNFENYMTSKFQLKENVQLLWARILVTGKYHSKKKLSVQLPPYKKS